VRHFDHHETALWINKYPWGRTVIEGESGKCCGTSLFYEYMTKVSRVQQDYPTLADFVELVRRWDTWEWKNVYNDLQPKKLNDLLHVYGPYRFDDTMVKNMLLKEPPISPIEDFVIQLEDERNNKYMTNKAKELIKYQYKDMTFGIVYADRCISELGNMICEQNPDIDMAVLIDPARSISLRTTKNMSCSDIAKSFGGGGHKFAAGFPAPKGIKDIIIDLIFKYKE